MKKLTKRTYKGIEYIRLSSLPASQAESLKQTLNHRTLIKILHEEVVLTDCVLYTAYEQWYANYSKERQPLPVSSLQQLSEPITTN